MTAEHRGQASDQHGEQSSVEPVEAGLGVGSAKYRDLVAQHEELDVLVEDLRPTRRTSPTTCRKIKYSSRSDTPGSCPTSDHRWSADAGLLTPHRASVTQSRRDPERCGAIPDR
jgi:hypothetical protein